MLPYALAIIVGLSSSVLFVTAFFFPDIHRKDDFLWSGIGLFYALVLWFCATSIRGAVLLGQIAVVALVSSYFWQIFNLRRAIANPELQADFQDFSVLSSLQNLLARSGKSVESTQGATDTLAEDPGDTVIETKQESPSQSVTVPETIADEVVDTAIETKEEPIEIKKVPLKPTPETLETTDNSVETTTPQGATPEATPGVSPEVAEIAAEPKTPEIPPTESNSSSEANLSETDLDELLDVLVVQSDPQQDQSAPEKANSVVEETNSSEPEVGEVLASQSEVKEIVAEQVTIIEPEIEEETNWDDEIEDIPPSAVTVIQAETAPNASDESTNESQNKPTVEAETTEP